MAISVSSRKAKGRNLQKWVCEKISNLIHLSWGKDKDIESRGMGQSGTDVRLSKRARKKFPYSVECKRQEAKSIPFAWIEQAQQNKQKKTDWLLVVRRSREKPIVIMEAEQFFVILSGQCVGCNLESNHVQKKKEE